MLKEFFKFQRVLGYPAAFNINTPPRHMGKIIISFIVLSMLFSNYYDFLAAVFGMLFAILISIYSSVNKSFSLWRLFPISYKKAINYIYGTIYLTLVISLIIILLFSLIGLTAFYFTSSPSEFNSYEGLPSFLEFIQSIFSIDSLIVFIISSTLIHLSIPLCFLKKNLTKGIGFSIILGTTLLVGAIFKASYGFTLSEYLYNNIDINTKLILLSISSLLFILSLLFTNKISKNIYINRFLKVN